MDVMHEANARAAEGRDIIHMEVGQQDRYRVSMLPERVVVTAGSSAVLAFLAVLDSGDTLLLPSPGYPLETDAELADACRRRGL
jgi:DNA-binding transcriptional MocR family regulator